MNRATSPSMGQILATFSKMTIVHPLLDEAHGIFDDLRTMKQQAPDVDQKCAALFAPSQAGKSTTVKTYIQRKVVDDLIARGEADAALPRADIAKLQKVVLHITLPKPANPKTLAIEILRALGDPNALRGTTESLLHRAYVLMKNAGTELLFVDEVQHLSASSRIKIGGEDQGWIRGSTAVTDNLKLMLIRGLVPLVLVGISESRHHLFNDNQLASRCVRELNYDLRLDNEKERKCFLAYCGMLGLKLRDSGLFPEASDFVSGHVPACLFEASGGLLGMVSNLVQQAAILAAGDGSRSVAIKHLAGATEEWAMPRGIARRNPFADLR